MNRIKAFGAFWYDFVIGDDWHVAALVVAGLAVTAMLRARRQRQRLVAAPALRLRRPSLVPAPSDKILKTLIPNGPRLPPHPHPPHHPPPPPPAQSRAPPAQPHPVKPAPHRPVAPHRAAQPWKPTPHRGSPALETHAAPAEPAPGDPAPRQIHPRSPPQPRR